MDCEFIDQKKMDIIKDYLPTKESHLLWALKITRLQYYKRMKPDILSVFNPLISKKIKEISDMKYIEKQKWYIDMKPEDRLELNSNELLSIISIALWLKDIDELYRIKYSEKDKTYQHVMYKAEKILTDEALIELQQCILDKQNQKKNKRSFFNIFKKKGEA